MEKMAMNIDFWKGKTVFITGHTGFKGSWLSLLLQELGADVVGYALKPPTTPSLFETANVADGMISIIGDINDYTELLAAIDKHSPDIIFHLAAQSLVKESYLDPVETFKTNIMGTIHLLEAARQTKTSKALINITSDKCYKNNEWNWGYRENDPLGGHDPYSASKACSEIASHAYQKSFYSVQDKGPYLATARAGNVIGGGDWAKDRLIPDIFRAITSNQNIEIRSPNAIRPWQHVLEALHGYLILAENVFNQGDRFTGAWNFGPYDKDVKSVRGITAFILSNWPGYTKEIEYAQTTVHEAKQLKLDPSKAITELGWKPVWCVEDALLSTINWQKALLTGDNIRNTTCKQIQNYLTLSSNPATN